MNDSVEQNPTPDNGGASTLDPLDRLERWLGAEGGPDEEDQPATEDQPAQEDDVKPDGDGPQSDEPQLTTSDLAKFLGLEESALDLDEDGSVKIKTKVDGVEGAAKLQDLLKSYQLQEHVDKKSREASEREKALEKRAQEEEARYQERLQYADRLNNIAAQQLMHEFQSIDWRALEAQDPGTAALWRQKFQERHSQLQQVDHAIKQERMQKEQRSQAETQESLRKEAERLSVLIPEWKDASVANKERAELREWAIKAGYEPSEIDSISKAHHVAVLRKAMLADRLALKKPEIENKVRQAPKLVKPGQPQADRNAQSVQNLKQSVKKSSGSVKSVMDYLMATGKA